MKILKRAGISIVLVLAMVVLVACGGQGSNSGSATGSSTSGSSSSSSASSEASAESGDSAVEAIKASGKFRLVTNAEFPPFEYKDGDEIIGIDIEIGQAIAEELGVELEITDIAFDSTIPSVTSGKADVVLAGMTITEDRLKSVDFSDNYFNANQVIIVAKGSDITSRDDLDGKVVGVQQGTTGDIYVTDEDGELEIKVSDIKRYPKGMDAVSDLIAGRLDAVVIDNFPAKKLVANNADKCEILDEPLTEEQYAIAIAKGSDLTAFVNDVIKKLNDSGKMDEIVTKYTEE